MSDPTFAEYAKSRGWQYDEEWMESDDGEPWLFRCVMRSEAIGDRIYGHQQMVNDHIVRHEYLWRIHLDQADRIYQRGVEELASSDGDTVVSANSAGIR